MTRVRDEANRLAKYRSVYAGSLAELGQGRQLGLLPRDHPGIVLTRDLIEKVLLARAELNAFSRILVEKNVITQAEVEVIMADEYAYLADAHEKITGYKATADGLTMTPESARRALQHQLDKARQDA